MKLALGTVQFGLPYGIKNSSGIPIDDDIKQIFSVAKQAGIEVVDTAIAYGNAEERIGLHSNGDFKIITKFPSFPEGVEHSYQWLSDTIDGSLNRLKLNKIHGVLLHRPSQLLEKEGDLLFKNLQQLKTDGKVDKIGISIYEPSELDALTDKYKFDIVQAPLNIFDRRLIETEWLFKLADMRTEVHVRSVFLQGLLLVSPLQRLSKFDPWSGHLSKYDNWLKETGITALEACLRFVLSFPEVSNVIIGIDNCDQLKDIITAAKGDTPLIPVDLSSNDLKLINPLSWLDF